MRRLLLLLLLAATIQHASAQSDSVLLKRIQRLFSHDLAGNISGLTADSVVKKDGQLHIFFNVSGHFSKGEIDLSAPENLLETSLSLHDEAGVKNVLFWARSSEDGQWHPLDAFTYMPEPPVYKPVENNDSYPAIPGKNAQLQSRVFPGSNSFATGSLTGKTVWLSPGHGWYNAGSGFTTQRGTTFQLVEDFITAESIDYYLQHYLTNAGAKVWSVRERDVNPREVIVDNDQGAPHYTETGTWTDGTIAGYGGTYRTAMASPAATSTAVFSPQIDSSALYWVSVRFIAGTNRATDVKYIITHAGGSTTFTVNQEIHSNTWIHLGQFYFFAGQQYSVTISNESAEDGQAIVADAVRWGGGRGQAPDCTYGGLPSGRPRFEESAAQFANYQGYPTCYGDPTVRPLYAEWEMNKGTPEEIANSIFVSFHTNAAGGRGTETYRYNGLGAGRPNITAGSTELRGFIHNQVVADLRAGWQSTWADRGVKEANFAEFRLLNTMPGILLELAFHDQIADASALKAPEFRRMASRAIYKGIVRFYNNRDGSPLNFLPEEPRLVRARNTTNAQVEVSWDAPVSGGIYGDAATGYRVYVSENGKGFDNGTAVSGTNYTFSGVQDKTYFFKITATNAGGESFASSVVAARTPSGNTPVPYLIVDGFDRLDSSSTILRTENATLGNVRRMLLERINSYDYMVEHGNGLSSCGIAFDGAQNEVVANGLINLGDYYAVDWYVGEESTVDKSLDANEKQRIATYLDGGGRLLLSGAEIAYEMRAGAPNTDVPFLNNYLKATYVGDDANTYVFAGTPSLFTGQTGAFSDGTVKYYNVDFPDRLGAVNGSEIVLTYSGGTGDGAGVGYKGAYNLLFYGFPIETILDDNVRNNLLCASVNYLATPLVPLPVSGLELQGQAKGLYNELRWITRSEVNTGYFIVERSVDGISYEVISERIPARGNQAEGASYTFIDRNVKASAYYRVRAIDHDTRETISNIVLLKNNQQSRLYVVQNPAESAIRVRSTAAGRFGITLVNAMGQTVYTNNVTVGAGQEISIPVDKLARGAYWLSAVMEGKERETFKVMLQ
ncbi:N-acetylmuramoyl-L-alanine amidase [Terrimonas ferruginea]|uniref:golvesin C-terminal-like domain-containing protein n=1 Tax=Terrimonas ferruginea TaxID=249 RepID=UPI00041898A4|nr:N-acetylmuramoyl-L-alanine amidase [Terrimonas ferruginea]